MGSFKILMSIAVTTLMLLQGCNLVASRPSGSFEETETYDVSKDYYALQNLLSKHLGGTSTEKSKVIDLLLQLLEEIDLPTLCEVIVNDTKANQKARLRVPIKYTKIDGDLLNSLDSQITETRNNDATFQTPLQVTADADRTTSAESREHIVVTSNDEESRDRIDGAEENNHTPATFKYYTNELNNGDRISSQKSQYVKDDGLNNVNYPDTLSSSNLSSGKENPSNDLPGQENPTNDLPGQDLLHAGQILYSSLLKDKTAPVHEDGKSVKSVRDLKEMYLSAQNKNMGEVNGMLPEYTDAISNNNILVERIDVDRPRAQLFSQSLVLGDWMNKNKFDRNFLTTYTDNEDEVKAIDMPSYENNVVASDAWSEKVKSEFKTRFSPTKQQKYARGYLDSQDIVGQMLIAESSTPSSTMFTYDPKDSLYSITPEENQRHVDYPEEKVIVQKPNRSISTVAKDSNPNPRDDMASMAMFTQMKSNPANMEYENEVIDGDSNKTGKRQQIKMSADYSTTQEFIHNNEMNEINNNKIAQEIGNWKDASNFMPESRATDKSDELGYGEHGVSVDINTQTPPYSYQTTTPISHLSVEPQVQPLLYETDNKTANTSATQLSQNPSEIATQATVVFSTTVDAKILTGNYEMTQRTASTAQEQAVTETAEESREIGVQQHTPASNLPQWAQRLNTDSSETVRTQEDAAAVSGQTEPGNLSDNVFLNNEEVKDRNSTALFESQIAQSKITYPENDPINASTTTTYPQMEANMKEAKASSALGSSFVDKINATEISENATQDWMTNESAVGTGVGQNEITQAGVTNIDVTQAGVTNSDVTQAGVTNSDVTQAGVTNNDVTQAGVTNSDVKQAGVTNSDVKQAGVTNSDVKQAVVTNSDVKQAGVTNSDVKQAVVTNSDVKQAGVTNSDVTQVGVTNSDVTQVEVTNSDVTQTGLGTNEVTQSGVRDNEIAQTVVSYDGIQTGVTKTDTTQPGISNNEVTQASITNSDVTQATFTNDDLTKEEVTHSDVTPAEVTNIDITQARVSINEATQAEVTNSKITQAGVSNTDVMQARIINNNVTQIEVNKNEVTQTGVSYNEVNHAGVSNNEVTQAKVSNNEVTQAGVSNNEVIQAEVSNKEGIQARTTHSDITNIVTNNVTYPEDRQTDDEVTNNQMTTTGFTTIVTQQSSELDATTDQIQHTSEAQTLYADYLPSTQTNISTVLFLVNVTSDARFHHVSTKEVSATTINNNLHITNNTDAVVQEESALYEKEIQDNIFSIVNDTGIARNMSKDNKSDIGDMALHMKNQTSVLLSTYSNVLGEQILRNNSYISAEPMESRIQGDVNNVNTTADRGMDKDKAMNMTNESEFNTTRNTEYYTSSTREVTSSYSNFQASVNSSPVSKTMQPELQSYRLLTEINASLSINGSNNEISLQNVTPTLLENSVLVRSLNESLGVTNITTEVENSTTTVAFAAFNSEWSASMQTDSTPLGGNTTVSEATENITVDSTVDNFHVAPKYSLEKTADFDHFIKPAVIEYGSNKVDESTLDISIKQQSSETSSVKPTLSMIPVTTQNATQVIVDNLTDHKDKGIYNFADTEHNTTGFTSQATISFFAADANVSETNNTSADAIQSSTLAKPIHTGTLSQFLRSNITTDNLKMIFSKIAETKANLSRINMDLLKPLRIRIPYEDSTEILKNTETTGISEEKNTSSFKSEVMEQQAAFTPETTSMVPQYVDNSTKLTYIETPAVSPVQFTTTEPTTSTLTATSAASSSEMTSPDPKVSISSVEVISSTITVPTSTIPESSQPSSTDSSYKTDISTDVTPNMLDGVSGNFKFSNVPNLDNLSNKDKTLISSTSLPKSGNEAKVNNFHFLPLNKKYQNKPSNLPYKSQFSVRPVQAKVQKNPGVDSWKAYNIAVGKSKTNAINHDIVENPGAPEVHLYSNIKYTPAPADNLLRSYLWQARPWPKNAMYNSDQSDTHNRMLAAKPELYQNQVMDKSKSVNYQTKTLKKIDSLHEEVKKNGNTNIWGDRFSQGYYGRVFDDQSKPLNADDTTTWPSFHSRDMVNFDMLADSLKHFNGHNQVHGVKNKYNSLNGNLGMKSSHSFDLNQRYRNLMKNFPWYHTSELEQGKHINVEQKLAGSQPERSGIWREDSLRAEGQTESSTQPETWALSPARTDPSNQNKGIPAPEDYTCPGLFGYHKDPKNCQAFFICSWGMAHRVVCPPGTLYNSKEAVCDWAVNIRCTVTPDNDHSLDV